jgi:hypothetical protein
VVEQYLGDDQWDVFGGTNGLFGEHYAAYADPFLRWVSFCDEMGKNFIEDLRASGLVTQEELEGIAFRNAEKLLGLKAQK